jgi:predicted amidophosphoribosyltransferase
MPARLICGLCEATLRTSKDGRGVVFVLCEQCYKELKREMRVGPVYAKLETLRRPAERAA